MKNNSFDIDLNEQFEHLPNAPIVEAVIHWRARPERKLDQNVFVAAIKAELPDYPQVQPQQEIEMRSQIGPEGMSAQLHQPVWHGFRFESADGRQIAQFTRNGFVFSRLKPYEDWERFEAEARRLWRVYCKLAEPTEVQRLGVRFINLITPVRRAELKKMLQIPPKSPRGFNLPVREFMHQSSFDIPGHKYSLNVIQTMQPGNPPEAEGYGLILDLDVFTTQAMEIDEGSMELRLKAMRWIKDKAFFTILKPGAIKKFRG